jgi:hypothetical protein
LFYVGAKFGLTSKELRGLMVNSMALRKIFVSKRDEVTVDRRRLHIGELHDLYSSPYESGNKIKKIEMGGACSTYGERSGAYRVLVGKPEEKRPLIIPRSRWEDNIKLVRKEVCWKDMDVIGLAQD